MSSNRLISLSALFLLPVVLAAAPIPSEKRIAGKVDATLAVPAGQQPMHMPTAVAIDSKFNVFVADGAHNRIVRFNSKGEFLPPLQAGLNCPTGLSIDKTDCLWVADAGNHRVLMLNAEGGIDRTIELRAGPDRPAKPTDLVVTPDGSRLYVVDNDNHRVLIRDQKTGDWTAMGAPGRALGQFQYPFMLALGTDNDVFITEAIGARVQILSREDKWAGQISGWGVRLAQLYRPKGIAADASGRVFVSDSSLNVVQAFTARGIFDGVLTNDQGEPMRFGHPMGMAFDSGGRLYVVELNANCVSIVKFAPRTGGAK